MKLRFEELQGSLMDVYPGEIHFPGNAGNRPVVILDDDPTGCQTVYGVPVTFSWDIEVLKKLFQEQTPLFFILTNTRSMTEQEAVRLTAQIVSNIKEAASDTGTDPVIVSRSDSTLRGHYPAEVHAIERCFPETKFMHCMIPAFFQGGRYTVGDVHYVREGKHLVPADETPFAADSVFGFTNSNLKKYVEEKTRGKIARNEVLSISIEQLRSEGPEGVSRILRSTDKPVCIVNAFAQKDLDVFAAGAWDAIKSGKHILFRTAASFLNSFGGIPVKDPLSGSDLVSGQISGGLIVAGSYVPRTTSQLDCLIKNSDIYATELKIQQLISGYSAEHIQETLKRVEGLLSVGKNVLLYTSRKLFSGNNGAENLQIGAKISAALVEIVSKLETRPSFIVAKGGITSHVLAMNALQMQICNVEGQALPGVPVLSSGEPESMKYIIFPGNVGEDDALLALYQKLTNDKQNDT